MTPQNQDRFGDKGNCMQACLASLLDIPLQEAPDVMNTPEGERWEVWLNAQLKPLGYAYIELVFGTNETQLGFFEATDLYHLVLGTSPRDPARSHAVIARNRVLVFDPHPDNTGVLSVEAFGFLIKTFTA